MRSPRAADRAASWPRPGHGRGGRSSASRRPGRTARSPAGSRSPPRRRDGPRSRRGHLDGWARRRCRRARRRPSDTRGWPSGAIGRDGADGLLCRDLRRRIGPRRIGPRRAVALLAGGDPPPARVRGPGVDGRTDLAPWPAAAGAVPAHPPLATRRPSSRPRGRPAGRGRRPRAGRGSGWRRPSADGPASSGAASSGAAPAGPFGAGRSSPATSGRLATTPIVGEPRRPEPQLDAEAEPDGRVGDGLGPPRTAAPGRTPLHLAVQPDQGGAAPAQRGAPLAPARRAVAGRRRPAHARPHKRPDPPREAPTRSPCNNAHARDVAHAPGPGERPAPSTVRWRKDRRRASLRSRLATRDPRSDGTTTWRPAATAPACGAIETAPRPNGRHGPPAAFARPCAQMSSDRSRAGPAPSGARRPRRTSPRPNVVPPASALRSRPEPSPTAPAASGTLMRGAATTPTVPRPRSSRARPAPDDVEALAGVRDRSEGVPSAGTVLRGGSKSGPSRLTQQGLGDTCQQEWAVSSVVEQLTFNQQVAGSNPARLTTRL